MIPNETIKVYTKGQNKPESVVKPLARSVEMVEAVLKVKDLSNLVVEYWNSNHDIVAVSSGVSAGN